MDEERFKIIFKPTLTQEIINHIKYLIANKELLPGDQLMPVKDIAEVFQASEYQVREALMYLVGAGVLEIYRKKGIFVAKDFSSAMLDPMVYSVILGQSDSLDTLKEMQKFIELSVLTLAAIKISKDDIFQLSAQFTLLKDALNKKDDVDRIIREENEFYFNIFRIAQNEPLSSISTTIRIFTTEARKKSYKKLIKLKRYEKLIQKREELFEAITKKKINDEMGSDKGDDVLRTLGTVLQGYIDEDTIVGRYGGDTFLIIFENGVRTLSRPTDFNN